MTAATLPRSTRAESRANRADELPPAVGGWSLTPVAAGWWLSGAGREAPEAASLLLPEPGRPSLLIDADGPDERTDRLLRELPPVLSSSGIDAVRLMLSSAADRYAKNDSCAPGLDLIAADGPVVITPDGYGLVRPAVPAVGDVLPQWWRRFPDGECEAAGVLAPSPEWERRLAVGQGAVLSHDTTLRRVPAGLALARPGRDAWLALAQQVWPDPERLTIVVDGTAPGETIRDDLTRLLTRLALFAADGIRLYWPRAGAGSGSLLRELAGEAGVDLIAPAADVSASEFGAMCHGPAGAAPWLRFGQDGSLSALGSLYPEPAWERALAETALTGLPADLVIEDVAAGVCVCRPEYSQRALSATARSILPDPARVTIVAAGDAGSEVVRQDVAAVLRSLPGKAAGRVRLLLSGAGSGGEDSYAPLRHSVRAPDQLPPGGKRSGRAGSSPSRSSLCRLSPCLLSPCRSSPSRSSLCCLSLCLLSLCLLGLCRSSLCRSSLWRSSLCWSSRSRSSLCWLSLCRSRPPRSSPSRLPRAASACRLAMRGRRPPSGRRTASRRRTFTGTRFLCAG
jgi:hypothetical protein